MTIVSQDAVFLSTLLPAYPLLAAPPKRPALPAPKIVGYLAAKAVGYRDSPFAPAVVLPRPVKRVVTAEIVEHPRIDVNIYKDPEGFWAEFERIFGPDKSIEEMDAELEARHPGYLAWVARMDAQAAAS